MARDFFVHDSIEHAAEHEHRIFIAYPLVFAYLHELFWPRPRLSPATTPATSSAEGWASTHHHYHPTSTSSSSLRRLAPSGPRPPVAVSFGHALSSWASLLGVLALNVLV